MLITNYVNKLDSREIYKASNKSRGAKRAVEVVDQTVEGVDVAHVNILEQSGFHGYLEPHHEPGEFGDGPVGGAAWHSTEIRAQRKELGELLLLSGGDIFTGPELAMRFDGKPVIDVMNHDHYDSWTLGNHDLDKGQKALAELIRRAEFPVLAANLELADGTPVWETDHILHDVKPFIVKEIGGAKVGVIGLMKPDTAQLSRPDNVAGLKFSDAKETLQKVVPVLIEQEHPDVVVLHYQYLHEASQLCPLIRSLSLETAGYAPYVVAVGGHGYHEGEIQKQGDGWMAVESTDRGVSLNLLQLQLDKVSHKLVGYEHDYLPVLPDETLPDPEIIDILDKYREQLADEREDYTLGVARGDFPRRKDTDGPAGSLVTDAMRVKTGADIAFLAGGTIKSSLYRGPIAMSTLEEVLPFDDKIVTVTLKGRDILKALEESVDPAYGSGKVLQMSGLKVYYDPDLPAGHRVMKVLLEGDKPLELDKDYRVSIDDFLYAGGDGYTIFKVGSKAEVGGLVRELVAQYVQDKVVITPVPAGSRLIAHHA